MNDEEENEVKKGSSATEKMDSAKEATKKFKNFSSKFKKSKAGSKTLVKVLGKFLTIGGWVLMGIIVAIGLIMFFLTMPGMVMEKIKGLFKALADSWNSWWGQNDAEQFEKVEIYNVLNYLDEMGYDLKGYGFVTDFLVDPNTEYDRGTIEGTDVPEEERKSTTDGVIRDSNNKVITGVSEFISTYLVSENYIYTIKNFNVDTNNAWDAFWNHVQAIFNTTAALSGRSGMLVFWKDSGEVGKRGEAYSAAETGYIKFEDKKLLIKKGWTNAAMEYSLDGWTGRYGMPVDFLLTVHLATQMPDLAYDMATTFDTEVNILLHSSEGTVYGAYKNESGEYQGYDKFMDVLYSRITNSTNWLADIINSFDDLVMSAEEMEGLHELGVYPPGGCTCTNQKTYTDAAGVSHVVTKSGEDYVYYTYDYSAGYEYPALITNTVSEEDVVESSSIGTVGTECKEYAQYVVSRLRNVSDDSYKTYTPYIESVQNHWFRDVYFVEMETNDAGESISGFVDYDYQYELITGERWTLYETDENGDFVYYVMNEDGSTSDEIYTGNVISGEFAVTDGNGTVLEDSEGNPITERLANRGEDGTLVVKKAKLVSNLDDLGWNESEWGSYIAYDPQIQAATPNYDPLYSESEIAEAENELEKDAMEHMYIEIAITNVTQTGEGLRTETNPKIKKMFLSNNYFKYDGSQPTAEIIYALREASGVGYGAIDDDKLESTYNLTFTKAPEGKFTSTAEDKEYKLGDYVGNVTFQQDALNTFAMLENSHTLDADYIYKDFKELVVELGYFDKEELTESAPKLLQWLIPEIGSAGYPDRSIDKNEAEYGTMIHSKMDIDANKKNLIQTLIEEGASRTDTDAPSEEADGALSEVEGISVASNTNVGSVTDSSYLSSTPINRLTAVGAIADVAPADYTEEDPPSGSDSKHVVDYTFNGIRYEGWKQTSSTCTLYAFAFMAAAYEGKSNEDYLTNSSGSYCSLGAGVSNTYWNDSSYFQGFGTVDIPGSYYTSPDTATEEAIAEALSRSIPVYFFTGFKSTAGNHAVVLLGCDSSGKILYYNPASGVIESYGSSANFKDNLHTLVTVDANQNGGCIHSIFIPDEPPEGAKSSAGANSYVGYKGNEAVVSPVTGILIEYGTYDAESAQENRENIDLKYGGLIEGKEYQTVETTEIDPETGEETTTTEILYPYDKVGYAVIQVLDAETYKKLESTVDNKWKDDSLVEINERSINYNSTEYVDVNKHISFKERTDELVAEDRDWTALEETVYGYKEFVEQYEQFGIGGYYIYIDGFKCETVGEESDESGTDESDTDTSSSSGSFIPTPGDPLTIDSFKVDPGSIGEDSDDDEGLESLYEPDEVSKLVSESYSEKLKAESAIKSTASPGITFSYEDLEEQDDETFALVTNEYILIKEGTVIGRTYTDMELLDERDGDYGTYEEYVEAQAAAISGDVDTEAQLDGEETEDPDEFKINSVPLIGNYLRIIMQETNGDIVEDVEDYMKIDDSGSSGGLYADLEAIDENSTIEEKIIALMGYLIEQGFSEEGAAGVVGNIFQESRLSPTADNGTHFGLCQWNYSGSPESPGSGRWNTILTWMSSQGYNYDSFAGQARGICESPDADGYTQYFEQVKSATSVSDAADIWCRHYEICGNYDEEVPKRTEFGEAALKVYKGEISEFPFS